MGWRFDFSFVPRGCGLKPQSSARSIGHDASLEHCPPMFAEDARPRNRRRGPRRLADPSTMIGKEWIRGVKKRPRRPGSHRGHQLRPRGQERPGETQLGSAMLSLLRRLMTRKGSSLNEPERKILQAKAGMPAPRSGSRTLATRRFRWGKVLGFPPQKGVGLRVLSQDFGRLPRELPQQVHFRVVLDFGQPINGHFDGHGALDYPGGRERCWIAREFLEESGEDGIAIRDGASRR